MPTPRSEGTLNYPSPPFLPCCTPVSLKELFWYFLIPFTLIPCFFIYFPFDETTATAVSRYRKKDVCAIFTKIDNRSVSWESAMVSGTGQGRLGESTLLALIQLFLSGDGVWLQKTSCQRPIAFTSSCTCRFFLLREEKGKL